VSTSSDPWLKVGLKCSKTMMLSSSYSGVSELIECHQYAICGGSKDLKHHLRLVDIGYANAAPESRTDTSDTCVLQMASLIEALANCIELPILWISPHPDLQQPTTERASGQSIKRRSNICIKHLREGLLDSQGCGDE
jgi:hypothetical protein